jgi:ABC-type bacteriocin/lantibiotic exporter with double-glycine peptidase domain
MLTDIEARPGRFEAMVTEYGGNFSGGQCQRLEIARAIAANPVVLVLDEATAALDPLVEQEIEAQSAAPGDHLTGRGASAVDDSRRRRNPGDG